MNRQGSDADRAKVRTFWCAGFLALLLGFPGLPALAAEADNAEEPPLQFQRLGQHRGLNAEVTTHILLDSGGFLWVSTREGLFRYDGYTARKYIHDVENPWSLSDNDIRMVNEDRSGRIWVSTNTGGLNLLDPETGKFLHYRHDSANPGSLSYDSVYDVVEDDEGKLWVATQIGLNRMDPATGHFERFLHDPEEPGSLSNDYIYPLLIDRQGVLWIGTIGGGLNRRDSGSETFTSYDLRALTGSEDRHNEVASLAEGPDGSLWVGTRHGLIRIDETRSRFELVPLQIGDRTGVISLKFDSRGQLWAGTFGGGLIRIDPDTQQLRHIQQDAEVPGSLPDDRVMAVELDTMDRLFVGSWGSGVAMTHPGAGRFRLLGQTGMDNGLSNSTVTALLPGPGQNTAWVGTFGGGLHLLSVPDGRVLKRVTSDLPIEWTEAILSLAAAPDGTLWAGTTRGVWQLSAEGESMKFHGHKPADPASLGPGYVNVIRVSPDGVVWAGVGGSGLFALAPGTDSFRAYRHDPDDPASLSGDYISTLLLADTDHIWVGTRSNGLNYCDTWQWQCQRLKPEPDNPGSLGHHYVSSLFEDRQGRVWVGTAGGGLNQAVVDADDRIAFRHWGIPEGLIDDNITMITADTDDSLWIGTRNGLTRFLPAQENFANFVAANGLPVSHFNQGSATAVGSNILLGSIDGVVALKAGQTFPEQTPFPVRLTAIRSLGPGGREYPLPQEEADLESPFGEILSFEFAVIDYSEQPHEYDYQLQGLSDNWLSIGSRREVTFTSLAPGTYRFTARGRDSLGAWSQTPTIRITVVPPFWMTNWFRALLVLLFLAIVFGLYKRRTSVLKRRNRELLALKTAREKALVEVQSSREALRTAYANLRNLTGRLEAAKEQERKFIARELHDEFGQALTAAKINLQLVSRGPDIEAQKARIENTVQLVDTLIGQVRAMSLDLRPPLLDELGLEEALRGYITALAGRSEVAIQLAVSPELARLHADLEIVIFRIIQESVNNILRHASARTVEINLEIGEGRIRVCITDDGGGFDPDSVLASAAEGHHLGLLGMRERVQHLGGELDIDSAPGQGCRIEAWLPMDEQALAH